MKEGEKMSSRKNFLHRIVRNFKYIDIPIFLVVAFLSVVGLVTIYSITSVTFYNNLYDDASKYVSKQVFGIVLGVIGILFVMAIPYRLLRFLGFLAVWLNPVILIVTLLIGTGPGDVKSWLNIGPLQLQPVELVKIGLILAIAWFASEVKQYHRYLGIKKIFSTLIEPIRFTSKLKRWFLSPWGALIYTAILLLLVMMQPDLGSGLVLTGIGIVMVLSSGLNWKNITQFSVIIIVGFIAVWTLKDHLLKPHQLERFLMWKDPFAYAQDIGYQNIMGYQAIANGGFWGTGIGQGIQKYGYMSEPHNDFIASIIAEELGFVTIFLVVASYFYIGARMMRTALLTTDLFASLACIGLGSSFILQSIINLGGVSGTIPLTGVTLPFVSYGGTSVMVSLIMLGFFFNIKSHVVITKQKVANNKISKIY